MYQPEFMERALSLARQALGTPGTRPFGAVVVRDGEIVGEGLNHAHAHCDPTSHGEVEAIRAACRALGSVDLSGCELYSSCEPCPLCVAAMHITGISALYYAATLEDAGNAFRDLTPTLSRPIDIGALRREAGSSLAQRRMPAQQAMAAEANRILADWAASKAAQP